MVGLNSVKIGFITIVVISVSHGQPATNIFDPYVPVRGICADGPRKVQDRTHYIHEKEKEWLVGRKAKTDVGWSQYLTNVRLQDLDVDDMNIDDLPRIGIAVSGGGHRSMLVGASILSAFDGRVASSVAGRSGGILQATTYLSGLSGGSWLVSSLVANNFPEIPKWATEYIDVSTTAFYPGNDDAEVTKNYDDFFSQIDAKEAAGMDVNIVDLWGRVLSYQLLHKSDGFGDDIFFSDVQSKGVFSTHDMPFPILVAAIGREVENVSTFFDVFDFSPYESGSLSPNISAFLGMEEFGTRYDNGTLVDTCIKHLDNLGYLMATSAAAFRSTISVTTIPVLGELPENLALKVSTGGTIKYTAATIPSFLTGLNLEDEHYFNQTDIWLADGSNSPSGKIPLFSLFAPARDVDVAFVLDSSGDEMNLPTGEQLIASERYCKQAGYPFPKIPTNKDFKEDPMLLQRVTFFGCNETDVPTIVYIPNHNGQNWGYYKLTYTDEEISNAFAHGRTVIQDEEGFEDLPVCLGCLLTSYAGHKSDECNLCMEKYCR
eukprot:CFRG7516T1